jgi:hypothetical protein
MQLVVVDMGADAAPDQTAWVLEACSRAITNGRCVADAPGDQESPAAVAIVRVKDVDGRLVRIEVGRRRDERAAWSVREIEFAAADPPSECWRSVGLALATLVGEIEELDRIEETDEPAQAEVEAEMPKPNGASASAVSITPVDARVATEDPAPDVPFERPRAFLGAGALAALGSESTPVRWGAGGRFDWIFGSGLGLSFRGDYSRVAVSPVLDLDWLRIASGVGYRYFASDSWSFGLAFRAGVRGLGVRAEDDEGGSRSLRTWSPLVAGSADAWWQVASFGGLWLELELGSIGRATRYFGREGGVEAEIPFGEAAGFFGLWLSL